jgi:hypothetical protein
MTNPNNTYETGEYKFVNFSGILGDIRNCFLDDMENYDRKGQLFKVNSVICRKFTRHATLVEILKSWDNIDSEKINAIIIPTDVIFTSGGLFDCDVQFMANSIRVVDRCKRSIPLLIKRVDCKFEDLADYLKTGEGEEFLMQLECDREKLREQVCSFKQFKKFAKKEGLKYILENLIDKIEFKRLFMS